MSQEFFPLLNVGTYIKMTVFLLFLLNSVLMEVLKIVSFVYSLVPFQPIELRL